MFKFFKARKDLKALIEEMEIVIVENVHLKEEKEKFIEEIKTLKLQVKQQVLQMALLEKENLNLKKIACQIPSQILDMYINQM
jgi:hypothetical protein